MLFKHYDINVSLEEIWVKVKGRDPSKHLPIGHCRLNRMILYAKENGFPAVGLSVHNLSTLISEILCPYEDEWVIL